MAVIMFRNGRSEELGPAAQAPKTLADHWGGASGWRESISKCLPVQVYRFSWTVASFCGYLWFPTRSPRAIGKHFDESLLSLPHDEFIILSG
jgi:hypothetical protein